MRWFPVSGDYAIACPSVRAADRLSQATDGPGRFSVHVTESSVGEKRAQLRLINGSIMFLNSYGLWFINVYDRSIMIDQRGYEAADSWRAPPCR